MLIYDADKRTFLDDVRDRDIEEVVHDRYTSLTGKHVGLSELEAWRTSLGYMARVLDDNDIPDDMGVAVEFHIPQSSKRLDVTLTGHDADGRKRAVIVELKQWSDIEVTDRDGMVRTALGRSLREVVHPSYQAWSYATLLEGFNEAVYDGGIGLAPCAYLHNYRADGKIDDVRYSGYIAKAPLFLRGMEEQRKLRDFIKQHVRHGDRKEVLYELANGRVRPSKALADALAGMLKAREEFVLIDDQKQVYESAKAAVRGASPSVPRVVIVDGGPGTGKTVLAINLLVALTGSGLVGKYVSKNAAPRTVYEARLTGTISRSRFSNLFVGSGAFTEAARDTFDFLVVDEAHRLNEKSGFYGNEGVNQVKELIDSAKCAIFFIDEDQRVTLGDIGTKDCIREFARAKGAVVEEYSLASQFRCSGSDGYLAWLDDVLEIRPTANPTLEGIAYDFRVFTSPSELHAAIDAHNGNNRARVVAGYCWPWASKANPHASDIVIGGEYQRQWNLDRDGSLWIMAERSVEQVGCIHTCQGLELDYVGVIVGPDLVVRDGEVVTAPEQRARQDKSLKGYKSRLRADPESARHEADRIIKNTYRTLMTRGMKGCYVYATDAETAEYFRRRGAGSAS